MLSEAMQQHLQQLFENFEKQITKQEHTVVNS